MTVVLDTNVMVQMFGKRSAWRGLKLALQQGKMEIALSTTILLEYEEVICRLAGSTRWRDVERFLSLIGLLHDSVRRVESSFRFRTITGDPDDDAFADCAIVAGADWIITEDRHFQGLQGSGYRPQPITPGDFISEILLFP